MLKFNCYTLFFFLLSATTYGIQNQKPYTPTDLFLLNCGASSQTKSTDGRSWDSDVNSKFCISNPQASSSVSTASSQEPSVERVPYMTARVINSTFTYTFPVLPGPKFIRLYFYPATYSGLNTSTSYFTVTANHYTLLRNFSASLYASAIASGMSNINSVNPEVKTFVKEYIITVRDNQDVINLTLVPSPSSFAFINGIEIVSMPKNLYVMDLSNLYPLINTEISFYFDYTTSLETLYRLNVGGGAVQSIDDTGMFRTWNDDSSYIFPAPTGSLHFFVDHKIKYSKNIPAYVAPEIVYQTKRTMGPHPEVNLHHNLTWIFSVDSRFNYLLRLHFCETEPFVVKANNRVFNIFINNITADSDVDVILWSGGNGVPFYKDYVVSIPGGNQAQQYLRLDLHPNTEVNSEFTDAMLNGIEIFKLNNSDGSLAGDNPVTEDQLQPARRSQSKSTNSTRSKLILVLAIVGGTIGALVIFTLILSCCVHKFKGKIKDSATSDQKSVWLPFSDTFKSSVTTTASLLPTDLCRRFSIAEIREATENFHEKHFIGSGGFGNVYKGLIVENGTNIAVAIKRLDTFSRQGTQEFHTEIEMMSKLRHVHLVSLIGYCDDQREMILVYEHMERGNLREHLYRKGYEPLPWSIRLKICIGAAKGLCYLHTGAKHTIIHRDVKSTNILLDMNWVAKISDFGLSKTGPTSSSQTHVSTVVKGSFGYVDPEYYKRQQLTEKSDVYSFGVLLFEVLCGRPPVNQNLPKEQANLVEWARFLSRIGKIHQIIDPHLTGDIAPASLNKFVEIALSCIADKGPDRPTMNDVVWGLEFALLLQANPQKNSNDDNNVPETPKIPPPTKRQAATTSDEDEVFTSSSGMQVSNSQSSTTSAGNDTPHSLDKIRSETVFSEIMDPKGR